MTDELDGVRPHHTANVASVDGNGAVTVLEQNAPDGSPITVRGTFWFFRPQGTLSAISALGPSHRP